MTDAADSLTGVLLGTAVGDALGLPREGMSRQRAGRMFGGPPLRHRFLLGRGMISDDTEHTCFVAQSLLRYPDEVGGFTRSLAWRLRFWLLGLPAGIGSATLRSILKLWLGFSPRNSGVFSAGNGPAMRSAILGVCLGHDRARLVQFVRASTRLTHTDPRAERGALLIAMAAHHGAVHGPAGIRGKDFLREAEASLSEPDEELRAILDKVATHLQRGASAHELAEALGLQRGVSGYVYHTVPMALYCWLRNPADFRAAVEEVIGLGGDTDSTGAIVGGLAGATLGASKIPPDWLHGLLEWPRSMSWMSRLANRLAGQFPRTADKISSGPLPLFWPGLLPRNLLFLIIVLLHGLRRLLPPY